MFCSRKPCNVSFMMIKLPAYSNSHGNPLQKSFDRYSNSLKKSNVLRTESWCTSTFNWSSLLNSPSVLTLLSELWYRDFTTLLIHQYYLQLSQTTRALFAVHKPGTKCTYFQYKHLIQLAILKNLYLNHIRLFSYSMLMKCFRYWLLDLLD